MNRKELIDCIVMAYNQEKEFQANEDKYGTDEYIKDFNPFKKDPIGTVESQYATEFGWMMAREGFDLVESEYDEYLTQILEESASSLTLQDLD